MAASVSTLKELQRNMKSMGVYSGTIDGAWGPLSHGAFMNARRQALKLKQSNEVIGPVLFQYCKATAWSEKVSVEFIRVVKHIADSLDMPYTGADDLMACMAFETGETFSPTIKNGAGAPYYGLIQFGAAAAKDIGTTTGALVKLTAEEQLIFVHKFFQPYKGKLKTLGDVYLRILWPVGVGKPDDYVLWDQKTRPTTYVQNKGLDINKDGKITKAECCAKVTQKLVAGLHPKNLRV